MWGPFVWDGYSCKQYILPYLPSHSRKVPVTIFVEMLYLIFVLPRIRNICGQIGHLTPDQSYQLTKKLPTKKLDVSGLRKPFSRKQARSQAQVGLATRNQTKRKNLCCQEEGEKGFKATHWTFNGNRNTQWLKQSNYSPYQCHCLVMIYIFTDAIK